MLLEDIACLFNCHAVIYFHSYTCDDYVLNDNAASDIKILRSALSAVASQSFTGIEKRGRRILRSQSFHGLGRSVLSLIGYMWLMPSASQYLLLVLYNVQV